MDNSNFTKGHMMSATTFSLYLLMFAAGIGVPILAAMNATLGVRIGSPVFAALVMFGLATIVCLAMLLFYGLPTKQDLIQANPRYYLGGVLIAFYLLSISFAAPHIGLGNAIFIVLIGQLTSAAIIDHFGLFGVVQYSITSKRVVGLVLMGIGVFLARKGL